MNDDRNKDTIVSLIRQCCITTTNATKKETYAADKSEERAYSDLFEYLFCRRPTTVELRRMCD